MMDLVHNISVLTTLAPAVRNSASTGTGVDTANFDSAVIFVNVGTVTDGTHTLTVQDSSDNVSFNPVAAALLDGTLANLASNTNQKVGYKGNLRYLRVTGAGSGATGAAFAVTIILGTPRKGPK